jgi:hypothetical protein
MQSSARVHRGELTQDVRTTHEMQSLEGGFPLLLRLNLPLGER